MNPKIEIPRDASVERGFDCLAEAYAASEVRKRTREVQAFVDWIRPQPGHCALDVASGPATIARVLAASVKRVFALDLSHSMLCQAASAGALPPNLFLIAGNVECLPFPNTTFDLLTCAYAFAPFRDPALVLRELACVLAPSGRVALMDVIAPEDPAQCEYLNRLESMRSDFHTRIRTYSESLELFHNAGLKVEKAARHRGRQRLRDWLRLSPAAADPERSRELRQALLDSMPGDKAGLSPQRKGREVEFHYQTAWFLLRRGS